MPKHFIACVKAVGKKVRSGELSPGSSEYAICRASTGYYGTTHNIGMIHKRRR